MSNYILKPIINWILALVLGKEGLSGVITMLSPSFKDVLDDAGAVVGKELDLATSIYIDWGAFINAVINFFLVALVLFTIVKLMNKLKNPKPVEEAPAEPPAKPDDIALLEEIRDLLKNK